MKRILLLAVAIGALASTAWARHPELDQMKRVKLIAHDLETAARQVHRAAERDAHHLSWREEKALRALHDLEDRARHFHHEVKRYYRDPRHTEADYRALLFSYERAAEGMHYLHARRHVERGFYRVHELVTDLRYFYEGPRRGHGRYRGRYDRHHGHDRGEIRVYRPRFDFRWNW